MEGFKHTGYSKEELEDLFEKVNVNKNGEITFTEFLAATLKAEGELEEVQLEEHMISRNQSSLRKLIA